MKLQWISTFYILDSKYAITEIITTGLNFKIDRIIHISSFVVENNEIKKHLTSYINPERTLEPEYIRSTGIANDNIKFSPKFYEKAKDLIQLWDGCHIISSNPRLSLTFLKSEFKSLGFDFDHNIGSYSEFVDAQFPEVQRIEDKARLLTSHFLEFGRKGSHKKDFTPRAFLEKEIKLMPNECGIYILKNENGTIIYVGKANKIRTRLRQHFRNLNHKGFKIHRMVAAIDYQITDSELFALLLEHHHILKYKPELNKALRNTTYKYELRIKENFPDNYRLSFKPVEKSIDGHFIKRFKSKKSALLFAIGLILSYELDLENLEFYGVSKAKLSQHLEEYDSEIHETIDVSILDLAKIINPFYNGVYICQEKGHPNSYALIENGQFLGLSFGRHSGHSFEDLKENLEYKFQSEYALNQIIKYHQEGLLKITQL